MIKTILKLVKALHSDTNPYQLSVGFALGMIMGLTPFFGVHTWVLIAIVLLLKINIAMFLASWGVFSGIAYLLDPAFDSLGHAVLTAPALEGLWTAMYNSPFWRTTRFNHSIMMGSLLVSLVALVPVAIVVKILVVNYRERVLKYVMKSKLVTFLKGTKFFRLYNSVH